MSTTFSINFDYRCPFARNANEHVITALRAGAPYDVTFAAFSQSAGMHDAHPVWTDPTKARELLAVASGIVVRDRFPELFFDAHLSLFALRHDEGRDLRDADVVWSGLERVGVDTDLVRKELESGWPVELFRNEHEAAVREHRVFGVPTFVLGEHAVFVRLMHRPLGDSEVARSTVDRVLDLMTNHPEVNEYKHTSVPF
jgi:protein-disulfide isomerase-like protein with CxxC motif